MTDSTSSTEAIYGKSDEALILAAQARWKAEKAKAKAAIAGGKEPWELAAFHPDPEVAAVFSEPTKDGDQGPGPEVGP